MVTSTTPQIARLITDQGLYLALFGMQAGQVPTPATESVAQTLPSGVGLILAKVENRPDSLEAACANDLRAYRGFLQKRRSQPAPLLCGAQVTDKRSRSRHSHTV